jgi:hypothetical protein
MPISTTKVDKMLENIQARTVQDDIEKYGYKLKLMAASTQPPNYGIDSKVRKITDLLWYNRIDYSKELNTNLKVA